MKKPVVKVGKSDTQYQFIFNDVSWIIDAARRSAARSVNAVMTAAYWMIGHRIVEFEQSGKKRAGYGIALIDRLAVDLTQRFGRGFSRQNIQQMRMFYLSYPPDQIRQTLSGKSTQSSGQRICQTTSDKSETTFTECALGNFSRPFHSRGQPMSGCFPSRTRTPVNFTKPKPCAGVGRFANLTDKSILSSTSALLFRRIRLPCCPKVEGHALKTISFPTRQSRIRSYSNSSTSRTNTPRAIWKKH